jgi:hypothetical protein
MSNVFKNACPYTKPARGGPSRLPPAATDLSGSMLDTRSRAGNVSIFTELI